MGKRTILSKITANRHDPGLLSLRRQADRPVGVIDEILEERVVTGRGQASPRGVRQKMSGYPLRKRDPVSRREHDWTPEIVPKCVQSDSIALRETRACQSNSHRRDDQKPSGSDMHCSIKVCGIWF